MLATTQAADLHIAPVSQIEIVQYFVDARIALFLGGVGRHAQLGGIVERLVDGQLHMDDVALGHKTDVVADGIEVLVDVEFVDVNIAVGGRTVAGDGIDQGRFAATALADDDDKFSRLKDNGNILQNVEVFAHPFVQIDALQRADRGFRHIGPADPHP